MDSSKPPKPDLLLDDLEAIRQLLEKEQLEPPLLTETLDDDLQIPVLSEIIEPGPGASATAPLAALSLSYPVQPAVAPPSPPPLPTTASAASIGSALQQNLSTQGQLDAELRAAAQLILQDVIDDFVPQIEAELKRRLEARLDRLLRQPKA